LHYLAPLEKSNNINVVMTNKINRECDNKNEERGEMRDEMNEETDPEVQIGVQRYFVVCPKL
jgi:hypothetical protein